MRLVGAALLFTFACGKSSDKPAEKAPAPSPPAAAPVAPPVPPPSADAATAAPKPAAKVVEPAAKLQRYLDCWNAFDTGKDDVFAGCFAADGVREQIDSVPAAVARGPDAIVEMAKDQRAAFPDIKITPQLVIVDGNQIAAILHVAGTNTGEVPWMKKTGKKIGLFEGEVATMNDDGTFSHDAIYVDQPTLYHQLALMEDDTSPAAVHAPLARPTTIIAKHDAAETTNKQAIEADLAAVNKKDAKAVAKFVADNVKLVYHGEKQKIESKKAYMKWLADTLHSSKNSKIEIKGLWTAGDYVVVTDVFSGTPTEAAVGKNVEPKRIETQVLEFFRVKGGKLAEHQIFANRLKTAVQLGLVDSEELVQMLSGKQ